MCGICGFVGIEDKDLLNKMSEKIIHRGPDEYDYHVDKNIGMATRRLCIIDIIDGAQPMSRDGKTYIVYNGELFNYKALRSKLEKMGCKFYTESDTEVVLAAYEKLGVKCLDEFDGQFAIAIWDGKKLFLARDPLGIMPLYYCYHNHNLYFASEIKALLEVSDELREPRELSFDAYFSGADCTPFKNIYHMMPSCYMIAEKIKGHLSIDWKKYHSFPKQLSKSSIGEATRTVRKLVEQGITNQLVADVKVGTLLSGGLDSSIVSAVAADNYKNLNTFSIGTQEANEFVPARRMAELIESQHHEVILEEDRIPKILPKIIYHLENYNPRIVQTSIPNYEIVRVASRNVRVILSGEGSDEHFCGYDKWFRPKYNGDHDGQLHQEVTRHVNSLFQQNLLRVDKISMAHSVESRVPLLDKSLINYSMTLDPYLKMWGSIGKYVLRSAFWDKVPAHITWGNKQYFSLGAGIPAMLKNLYNIETPEEKSDLYKSIFNVLFIEGKKPEAVEVMM